MEDLKTYIESGVLELYVLGDLTVSERHEVELMLEKHPALREEIVEIEKSLQKYSEAHAEEAPEHLRSKILDRLEIADEEKDTPVVPIAKSGNKNDFFKYAFAASIALLLISLIAIINLSSQLRESNNQIAILRESNQKFSSRVNYVEGQLDEARQSLKIFHNPEQYKLVNLKGTQNAPSASMMVAFSAEKEEVMIDLASLKMPANDAEHQYQLWALVDGKPVDLGVFDAKTDTAGMVKMKSIKAAQAFAVTLEPKGGSVTPTMEQMMLMGSI